MPLNHRLKVANTYTHTHTHTLCNLTYNGTTCNPPANVGDTGWIPGSERSLGGGHGKPFQYSCLENPTDRKAWQAM